LHEVETRTGIAVSGPSNTAAESMIFTNGFLRLQSRVGFIAELSGLTAAVTDVLKDTSVLRWGGEGRHVACRTVPEPITWPKGAVGATTDGRLAVLITPAFLADGWHGQGWRPMAASVGPGAPVSGWDLARDGPKPTRFLAPAGSVFFFQPGDDDAFVRPSLCDGEDQGLGHGCFVTGGWSYA
jgi:CRISPR-associated protein Cmr3